MARQRSNNGAAQGHWPLVSAITVEGFKSIAERQRMDIRPLTILAGANSSGKSSMMQPALLIKQTLESSYDPGPLRIDGPNVKMTEFGQLFWGTGTARVAAFDVTLEASEQLKIGVRFGLDERGLDVIRTDTVAGADAERLRRSMTKSELRLVSKPPTVRGRVDVTRHRCFLRPRVYFKDIGFVTIPNRAVSTAQDFARRLIHVPGLRPGSAERQFPHTPIGEVFAGTFEEYFASVLNHWKHQKDKRLEQVGEDLETIGLTSRVDVQDVSDTALTVRVGRLPHATSRRNDLVNLADVGFGVSQVLPGIVAIWAAKPGDTVYIEQPELHLHPNAQVRLASVLANAAKRGVRVIAETHSSLLLLGIQTLVANGDLKPDLVKLHWFQRDKRGATSVTSADLDKNGAFGDWPDDFADVSLKAQSDYLDAVETRSPSR